MSRASIMALTLMLLALPALADDGATPIPFVDPYATPHLLPSPGHYVVTRNLSPSGPGGAIIIIDCNVLGPTPAVSLDLNGMVLDNTGGFDAVIVVVGEATCEVVIRNGELIGGTEGIRVDPPLRKLVVEDVEIKDIHNEGIRGFDVGSFAIRRNAIINSEEGAGIVMLGDAPKSGVIEDNIVRDTNDGIRVENATSLALSNNRVKGIGPGPWGGKGISLEAVTGCLVTRNAVSRVGSIAASPGAGIELGRSSCKIYNNAVSGIEGHGIRTDVGSPDCLVLDNVVENVTQDGIRIEGSRNLVQRNLTNNCGYHGLHLFANSVVNSVGRNLADTNNTSGAAPACGPRFPDFCDDSGTAVSQGDNVFLAAPF